MLPLASAGVSELLLFLSWQLCHKLFFPYALPLASAGVGGYIIMYFKSVTEKLRINMNQYTAVGINVDVHPFR